jgi:hypothetical protein
MPPYRFEADNRGRIKVWTLASVAPTNDRLWRKWMKASFKRLLRRGRVFTLIAMAATLAVLAGLPLSLNMVRFRENLAWVKHTNQVLHELSAIERTVLEAESAERGFLLTGDQAYLSTYKTSSGAIPKSTSSDAGAAVPVGASKHNGRDGIVDRP